MKNKWISIKRFKQHEFHTTLRRLERDENTWPRRFQILSEIEDKAIQQFLKIFGTVVIAYLLASSLREGSLLKVTVYTFEASIPVAYFLAASSFLLQIAALSFCHLSVAMSLKISESGKVLLPGFSTGIYGLLQGKKDDMSLGIPAYQNYFLKERYPVSDLLGSAILLGLLAALIPLAAYGVFLFGEQYGLLTNPKVSILQRIVTLFGMLFVVLGFLYAALFHVPLPTQKNTRSIRWSFLVNLSPGLHPQAGSWLDK